NEPQGHGRVGPALRQRRAARHARAVSAGRLRPHLRDRPFTAGRADAPRLSRSHRGRGQLGPLDGAGTTGRGECRFGQMARHQALRLLEGLMMRVAWIASMSALAWALPVMAQPAKPPPVTNTAPERPLPTLNIVVPERDRQAVYAYYRDEIAAGRCPPPLLRRDKACHAPSPVRGPWKLDQALPDSV